MVNKNYIFYKKGADKILSIYWFTIMLITAIGIFAMIYLFYSAPYDVRVAEADILSDKIADCISRYGKINQNFISLKEEDIMKFCSLNFQTEKEYGWENNEQYFFEIEIKKINSQDSDFYFSFGNLNMKEDCFLETKKEKEYKKLVKCSEKRIYAVDDSLNQYLIKILAGVGKFEKNVRN